MKNFFFYSFTVLIWGSTWFGIKLQLGVVDPMASVTYRFGLAGVFLLGWCVWRRLRMKFSLREHMFIFLQGCLLFGFNYLGFYLAEQFLTSGLAAVIFSTILWMNVLNGAIFLRSPFSPSVLVGGCLGISGIFLVFQPEITAVSATSETLKGILLSFAATLLASLGNIVSARNQQAGLPIVQSNGLGMVYGSLVMLAVCLVRGTEFSFHVDIVYIGSLLYLALFGSVIAFGCYLSLVGSIGADRAAYATLLFPIVALGISSLVEDYHWTSQSITGVSLILFGNFWMLGSKQGGGFSRFLKGLIRKTFRRPAL